MQVVGNEEAGGGANFLASIKIEVIPYIDANWPTNGFRTFSGHSLGGLTVLNFLVNEPDLFDAYIALTPSMEIGDGLMLDQTREFLAERKELDKMLYLSIGDEQLERIYFDQLVEFLEGDSPQGFLWESGVFEEEDDHQSIRITGNLAGIRWVFRDWRLTSNRIFDMTRQEIAEHFREATRRTSKHALRACGKSPMLPTGAYTGPTESTVQWNCSTWASRCGLDKPSPTPHSAKDWNGPESSKRRW
jgi:hypothetical protein